MGDSYQFAVDVFRTVCDRLAAKASDLRLMVETTSSFEEWLNWEAFLACKLRQESYPFCEVAAKPTYGSEGVATDDGDPDRNLGDLRVGGPNDGANHCWVFAEFALIHDGTGGKWLRKIEADADKLRRLGWRRSASLLVVVLASRGDVMTEWADYLAGCAVWNQPALTEPFVISLPGGETVALKVLDIKQNPADTLTPGGPLSPGRVEDVAAGGVASEVVNLHGPQLPRVPGHGPAEGLRRRTPGSGPDMAGRGWLRPLTHPRSLENPQTPWKSVVAPRTRWRRYVSERCSC